MSYILSALKKSQQERELGSVPNLDSVMAAPAPQSARRWPWALGGLLAVNLAVFGGFAWYAGPDLLARQEPRSLAALTGSEAPGTSLAEADSQNSAPAAKAQPDAQLAAANPAADTPAAQPTPQLAEAASDAEKSAAAAVDEPQIPAQPLPTANLEAPLQPSTNLTLTPAAITTPPAPVEPEPVQEVTAATLKAPEPEAEAPAAAAPQRPTKAVFSPPPIPRAKPEVFTKTPDSRPEAAEGGAQQAALPAPDANLEEKFVELQTFRQLPRQFRREFPELQVSLHMYHENPEGRFVRINKRKYREGAKLDDGPRLEEIRPNGIVLSYRGETFLLRN